MTEMSGLKCLFSGGGSRFCGTLLYRAGQTRRRPTELVTATTVGTASFKPVTSGWNQCIRKTQLTRAYGLRPLRVTLSLVPRNPGQLLLSSGK